MKLNPFYYYNRAIISIDTLKRDVKYRRYLEGCHWDVIVIDECQNLAVRGRGGQESQRARLAQLLGRTCDSMILTSATPHDGREESFASLMNLLEPTAVADAANCTFDVSEFGLETGYGQITHPRSWDRPRTLFARLGKRPSCASETNNAQSLRVTRTRSSRRRQRRNRGTRDRWRQDP